MKTTPITAAATWGTLAVALGALGAHFLPGQLEALGYDAGSVAKRLATFDTGVRYQMYSALAVLALGVGMMQSPRKAWSMACWLLLAGSFIFSGCLYGLAILSGYRWLGAVVFIGGVLMIAGWVMIAVGAVKEEAK